MTREEILEIIGGQEAVRNYLRGVEAGSETDKDALRAMRTAIGSMRAGGIWDAMASEEPELYGQACLLMCRMWSDAGSDEIPKLRAECNAIILQLRYDARNTK